MNDDEWDQILDLAERQKWSELWQWVQIAPPRSAATILRWLRAIAWTPPEHELSAYRELQQLAAGWNESFLYDLFGFRTSLNGHEGGVICVAFSPCGTQLASGSDDHTVRLWNLASGLECRRFFNGHTDTFISVTFSPDGTQLVSGSWDQSVRLWDVANGRELRKFGGHTDGVVSVSFSPDGTQLVSGSWDGSMRLWDVASGRVLQEFYGHTNPVTSVAFNPDGTQFVSGSTDFTVRLWDVASGDELRVFEGHTDSIASVAFSPDGTLFASGSEDSSIRVWDTKPSRLLNRISGQDLLDVERRLVTDQLSLEQRQCLEFVVALIRWHRRFDVEITDAQTSISPKLPSKFDIEIDG